MQTHNKAQSAAFDLADYSRPNDRGGYDLTAPAVIWMAAKSRNNTEYSPETQTRVQRTVSEVMALIRAAGYVQADMLAAQLSRGGGEAHVVLPMLREAINMVGEEDVASKIEQWINE